MHPRTFNYQPNLVSLAHNYIMILLVTAKMISLNSCGSDHTNSIIKVIFAMHSTLAFWSRLSNLKPAYSGHSNRMPFDWFSPPDIALTNRTTNRSRWRRMKVTRALKRQTFGKVRNPFLEKNEPFRTSFSLFSSFQNTVDSKQMFNI